jgi:multiple sugar transport system ATP-binding protein
MVYVTHDQVEAMTMGDRVAVMRDGRLEQCDVPQVLYDRPANVFVAAFIGSPSMNLYETVLSLEGTPHIEFDGHRLDLPADVADKRPALRQYDGKRIVVGIRPEDFEDAAFAPAGHDAGVEFTAPIEVVESMGSEIYVYFSFQGGEVSSDELAELARDSGVAETPGAGAGLAVARLNPESEVSEGEKAKLWFDSAKLHLFDPGDGSNVRRGGREQKAAAKATRAAVETEAKVEASKDAASKDDAPPAAPADKQS